MASALKIKLRACNHFLVDSTRDLRRLLVRTLFGRPFRPLPLSGKSGLGSILVFRLDRKLGDSVASTGFLRELNRNFPQALITVLTAPETADIYRAFPFLEVIPVAKGVLPSLLTVKMLKNRTFDVLIDTSHILSPKVIHLAGAIRARRKIAFKNSDARLFSDHVDFDEEYDHVTERYKKTLALLGAPNGDLSYSVLIPEKNRLKVDQALQGLGQPRFIVINSFAGAQMRNLREAKTTELVSQLHERFPDHLIVSIASPGDMRVLDTWNIQKFPRWRAFRDLSEFQDNCRLIEKADLVISVDTSIIHVASAFKTPVLGLYRAETVRPRGRPLNWEPYGTEYAIVESKADPSKPEQDINDIEYTTDVFDKIERLIRSSQ